MKKRLAIVIGAVAIVAAACCPSIRMSYPTDAAPARNPKPPCHPCKGK